VLLPRLHNNATILYYRRALEDVYFTTFINLYNIIIILYYTALDNNTATPIMCQESHLQQERSTTTIFFGESAKSSIRIYNNSVPYYIQS